MTAVHFQCVRFYIFIRNSTSIITTTAPSDFCLFVFSQNSSGFARMI